MQTFKYEVRDAAGSVTAGVIQAESALDASQRLRRQGGYLLNVVPVARTPGWLQALRSVNFQLGPSLKDIQTFTNQLAVMIKAGISIRNAIAGIAEQVENVRFR